MRQDTSESAMQPINDNDSVLDKRLDDLCDGIREAIDREVERRRREGLPIYVNDNGRVVDLQEQTSHE
jgi:predicted transcriptional regulator